jgi:heterodisulfide reductase subunit A
VLTYRDFRPYERALEGLYQRLCAQGYEFVDGDLQAIESGAEGGLRLTVAPRPGADDEEDEAEPLSLDADLVVLAAARTPARGARELHQKFGVALDRFGFPIENQPRLFRPTESLVDRVFVVGSSAGPKVVQQAAEQGSAAAMRALPPLLAGAVPAPRFASRVDPARCTGCRICAAVCPHGAITFAADPAGGARAAVDPAFCQACGLCAAACPVHAAELDNFTERQILDQVEVGFAGVAPGEPRLLALLCYWCAYSAADFAGIHRDDAPANHRVIRVRCSSSVNTGLLLQLFARGVDGIVVGGCPERSCHHLWGNFVADKRIELGRALLGQLGYDTARLRFEYIGAPMHDKLVSVLRAMDARLRALGPAPLPARTGGAVRTGDQP